MVADVISRLLGGAILAAGGWGLGEWISDTWGPELYVPWVLGLTAGGAIIGLAGTPLLSVRFARRLSEQTGSIPTSRLLSGVVGLLLGLVVAILLSIPIYRIPEWPGVVLPIALRVQDYERRQRGYAQGNRDGKPAHRRHRDRPGGQRPRALLDLDRGA